MTISFRCWVAILVSFCVVSGCRQDPSEISFNQEVRPLLNERCAGCHGGVKRAGGLSLLFREDALGSGESGKAAVVPGSASESELVSRIRHPDPGTRMPREGEPLSSEEIDTLSRWIDSGAEWETHWAYAPPRPPVVPDRLEHPEWPRNEIDRFILQRMEAAGLEPTEELDRGRLLRRVSLDLTGLPPTLKDLDTFLNDRSPTAYEKVVGRLLDSPRFGERWAALWVDLARYADTRGYERDAEREIWHYRDWLIRAFNRDLPFDQFTIEQLAGDLLPQPTHSQYVATAFHRNTMNNDEGGTDNEEYRVAAVIDRVNTTWEVWQGTSFACAQCHGHPYDPFRQEEYYESYAFFNNTRDEDTPSESPVYKLYTDDSEADLEMVKEWFREHQTGPPTRKAGAVERIQQLLRFAEPKIHPHYFEILREGTHADTKYLEMYRDGIARLPAVSLSGKSQILARLNWAKEGTRIQIRLDSVDGPKLTELHLTEEDQDHRIYHFEPVEGIRDLYFLFDHPELEPEVGTSSILWLMLLESFPGEGEAGFREVEEKILELLNRETPAVPILVENSSDFSRRTHVFERGNWLVPGDEVLPDVPDSLPSLPAEGRRDRLGFARWLVSPENPLTARVAVNRFWAQLFGKGLVETQEDFGTQGEVPSHPELLDWLALRFQRELGWSVKSLLREIVLSATYRQGVRLTEERLRLDPENRLLSTGPRVRLPAEVLRDQALAVGGLLSDKMFGPSVMPPQPDGVWQVIYSDAQWETSEGEDRFRRALYTYWRRTSPYPSMVTFDAPSREFCVPRRIRTNTPLQALVLLNDPVYVEAARGLAKRMLEEETDSLRAQLRRGHRIALAREPSSQELSILESLFEQSLEEFSRDPVKAQLFAEGQGLKGTPRNAALTAVANTIMNLDEFVTR